MGDGSEQALDGLRVAVVHDYLTQRGGAERVVLALLDALPGARLATTLYEAGATFPEFQEHDVTTSALQRFGGLRRDPRRALPLLPRAVDGLRLPAHDVVVCSSSGWAHGVRTEAPKVVYCHNPARWLYQPEDYLPGQPAPVRAAVSALRPALRRWDRRAAAGAARYLVNSSVVQERVRRAYGLDARVLAPPVSLDADGPQEPVAGLAPGFFLVVGRARGYKHVDVTCEAFEQLPDERLVVVGGLPERQGGWSERLVGLTDVSDAQLRWLYASSRALVATAHEDFGLTPLEANAFGTPALVLRAGGFLDSLDEGVSGWYVEHLDRQAVLDSVRRLLQRPLPPAAVRRHADRYSQARFGRELRTEVAQAVARAGR